MYHMRCSEDDEFTYHPKWFRLDITCQQIASFAMSSCTPFGISGGLVILPLSVCTMCVDLSDKVMYNLGMVCHMGCLLITSCLLDKRICLQWFLAFYVHSRIDLNRDNMYGMMTQTMWHLMCHWNIDSVFKGCHGFYDSMSTMT